METVHDLTAAYAVDALDADERATYESHLAQCERCRDELTSLAEAATSLAYAVDSPPPSAQLRERILTRARAERPNVIPLRPRWAVPAAAAAVLAVAAAIAVAFWASSLSHKLDRERTARSNQERVAAILSAAQSRSFRADGSQLVVTSGGEAALVLKNLQSARNGRTYEAWVAEGGMPRPAGTFNAGRAVTAFALDRPVPRGATVMVTEENKGGTDAPTTPPIITVNT
jgi:anti-sigma factor RsiW